MEITGVTYSVSDYEHYNQNGDLNYFEEVIDAMILDGISGMNDTFRNVIRGLSRDKKRMTILSLLDKDLNLFKRIKALTDKNIGKMDHIKDIILMLREYVKVGEVEKKKFGEVMTPLELVKEMLATLPEEVWSNPNLKWLDPANGTGPYPIMVIYKLMIGLAEWEPDAEKRYKHIVENMIYVCELQPKNMFLYMCAVDPFDKYKLNIYTGSFLEDGFDKHMKDVWSVEKFDVVIGNPPYQEIDGGGGNGSSATPIYNIFIEKSAKITNFINFVIPSRWMAGGKGLDKFRDNMKRQNHIKKIVDIFDASSIFPETQISGGVCYFLWDSSYKGDCDFNGELRNLSEFDIILRDQISINILKKILLKSTDFFDNDVLPQKPFGMRSNFSNWSENGIPTITRDGYKNASAQFVIDRFNIIDKYKLLISKADGASFNSGRIISKFLVIKPGEACLETHLVCGVYDREEEAINAGNYLLTKFARFMLSLRLISQNNSSDKFKWLPKFIFNKNYTDEYLYKYFNLDESEILYIDKKIKNLS